MLSLLSPQCPTCREIIKPSNLQTPPAKWAALLKTDFHIKELINFHLKTKSSVSDGISKPIHACANHRNKEVDLFCVDCSQLICHLCAGISHRQCEQVVSLGEAVSDKRATIDVWVKDMRERVKKNLVLISVREKHQKDLERQRQDCEKSIKARCNECRNILAKAEEELLKTIDKKFKDVQDKILNYASQFEEKLSKVKSHVESLTEINRTSSDYELLSENVVINNLDSIMSVHESDTKYYKLFLDKFKRVSFTFQPNEVPQISLGVISCNVEDIYSNELEISQTKKTSSFVGRLRSATMRNLPRGQNKPEIMPRVKEQEDREQAAEKETVSRFDSETTPQQKSQRSVSVLVPNITKEIHNSARPKTPDIQPADTNDIPKPILIKVISSRFKSDKHEPKLRDVIAVSPGNTLLVTDWPNQCVKAIHSRADRSNSLDVGSSPWAITKMGDNTCAVSLPLTKQVAILRINPTLMMQSSFTSSKRYSGLASLNNSNLVASGDGEPPSVDVINLYGEVLKTITADSVGVPLFVYPAYVSVTQGMDILVSDRKLGAVLCLTINGEVKFRFQPTGTRKLRDPSGVTSLASGDVLVAESRGLLRLTGSGGLNQAMVRPQDGILADPRGVAIDKDGHIYVTSHEQNVLVLG